MIKLYLFLFLVLSFGCSSSQNLTKNNNNSYSYKQSIFSPKLDSIFEVDDSVKLYEFSLKYKDKLIIDAYSYSPIAVKQNDSLFSFYFQVYFTASKEVAPILKLSLNLSKDSFYVFTDTTFVTTLNNFSHEIIDFNENMLKEICEKNTDTICYNNLEKYHDKLLLSIILGKESMLSDFNNFQNTFSEYIDNQLILKNRMLYRNILAYYGKTSFYRGSISPKEAYKKSFSW